jgi:hypothetical protein
MQRQERRAGFILPLDGQAAGQVLPYELMCGWTSPALPMGRPCDQTPEVSESPAQAVQQFVSAHPAQSDAQYDDLAARGKMCGLSDE